MNEWMDGWMKEEEKGLFCLSKCSGRDSNPRPRARDGGIHHNIQQIVA